MCGLQPLTKAGPNLLIAEGRKASDALDDWESNLVPQDSKSGIVIPMLGRPLQTAQVARCFSLLYLQSLDGRCSKP
jgi:hypothetical protein